MPHFIDVSQLTIDGLLHMSHKPCASPVPDVILIPPLVVIYLHMLHYICLNLHFLEGYLPGLEWIPISYDICLTNSDGCINKPTEWVWTLLTRQMATLDPIKLHNSRKSEDRKGWTPVRTCVSMDMWPTFHVSQVNLFSVERPRYHLHMPHYTYVPHSCASQVQADAFHVSHLTTLVVFTYVLLIHMPYYTYVPQI